MTSCKGEGYCYIETKPFVETIKEDKNNKYYNVSSYKFVNTSPIYNILNVNVHRTVINIVTKYILFNYYLS